MSNFLAAVIFPQWQGAARPIGYAAGTQFLSRLLPSSLPQHAIACEANNQPLMIQDRVKGLDVLARQADRAAALRKALPAGPVLTIGGDCAADLTTAAWAHQEAPGEVALVWIDGHADLNTPASSPSGHFHGMVARTLMGDGPASLIRHVPCPYTPLQVFYISARDCDPSETDDIARLDLFRLSEPDRIDDLIAAITGRGLSRIYLHLDLDVLDPAVFPYVGVPAAKGLTLEALCRSLQRLRQHFSLAGAAITELNLNDSDAAPAARPALQQILAEGFGL
ncbi:arginase family protein [Dongia soli]|uniref:Arginase family protein n=1 Tax=Dongia soli TaxID=600628 RepID=A0ABU5EDI8_9PROT|nr:arginase family protein [Dongia soli]MDY0884217.1 arginase family protein [Dongia soli]